MGLFLSKWMIRWFLFSHKAHTSSEITDNFDIFSEFFKPRNILHNATKFPKESMKSGRISLFSNVSEQNWIYLGRSHLGKLIIWKKETIRTKLRRNVYLKHKKPKKITIFALIWMNNGNEIVRFSYWFVHSRISTTQEI